MLFLNPNLLCGIPITVLLILYVCVTYAYAINLRRKKDDPEKKIYHPFAVYLAPVSVPLLFGLWVLTAVLFLAFLFVFAFLLVVVRKPFLFIWLDRLARKIGDPLLKINTRLIQLAFSPWIRRPRTVF